MNYNLLLSKIFYHIEYQWHHIYSWYNCTKFRLFGIKIGKGSHIYNCIYLKKHPLSSITIGHYVTLTSGSNINPLTRNLRTSLFTECAGAQITIGDYVGISSSCIWASNSITIGNYVAIGGDCLIMDTDAHSQNWRIRCNQDNPTHLTDKQDAANAPIVISDFVWIGAKCIILKGVTIGARSIIAAGSVVTKDIPSDCIAGGNPCRVLRQLSHN